jgi:hypothetical protein
MEKKLYKSPALSYIKLYFILTAALPEKRSIGGLSFLPKQSPLLFVFFVRSEQWFVRGFKQVTGCYVFY